MPNIVLSRIDERLIHGQVGVQWVGFAGANLVLVANDEVAEDPVQQNLMEMVLADQEGWDRYEAAKWLTMRRWLEANPDDDFAAEVRAELNIAPKRYVTYARECFGWGVFALIAR